MKRLRLFVACAAIACVGAVRAQTPPVQNVINLSASGTVEVAQDLLTIDLTASRDGPDAAGVQSQLKAVLDAALAEAKKSAQPGQMDVRTGQFSVGPRYARDGHIDGWRGTATLVLEGRDFARIAQTAGKLAGMTVASVAFDLSREQRTHVETDAQHIAVERFKSNAAALAREFGFTGYVLREVNVASSDFAPGPRPMARALASPESAPLPVEAGKSAVTVTVSGSVQLR